MIKYKTILDRIADIEHQQWMEWSRDIASKENILINRLERWKKFWKPYHKLSAEAKEQDRIWAEKVIELVPIKCPVYQCSGFMVTKEKPYPKGKNEDDFPDGMAGDAQTPDLICSNCGAIYQFKGFKK